MKKHSEARAEQIVIAGMKCCQLAEEKLMELACGDDRKVMIALAVKRERTVSLTWIAERLKMRTRSTVSRETTTLARQMEANKKLKKQYDAILRRRRRKTRILQQDSPAHFFLSHLSPKMPSNKNQHFLPQHYLRLFAVEDGKNIGVVRIAPFKFVVGPIKGQCQADWFYREDGQLDDWLKETEQDFAKMLPEILEIRKLSNEHLVGCRFLASLFYMRTKKAAEIHGLFSRRMFFDVVNEGIRRGEVPPPPCNWSMETVGVNGVSAFLVKNMLLPCFFEMGTLHCKLLEPAGTKRFVTSDHPVVCMNQLLGYEPRRTGRCYVGFSRSGFQLVIPLCPTLCLFFFDPKVYKVGNRRDHVVSIQDDDVELLNYLQLLNADTCLYTADRQSAKAMEAMVRQFAKYRVQTQDLLQVSHNEKADFYYLTSDNPILPRPWSFCKLQSNPRIPESRRRNDAWTEVVGAFMEHLDTVKPQDIMGEFVRFVENYTV